MDEAQLVDSLDREGNLSHVETSNVFAENLVLDQHSHQVTTGQELHEHVEESVILEGRVQLDQPRAVGVGQNVTLSADVSKLIFFVLYLR